MSCKAYLTVIDAVLLPADSSALSKADAAASRGDSAAVLAALLGVGGGGGNVGGQCALQANSGFNATTLVPGATNRQHTGTIT